MGPARGMVKDTSLTGSLTEDTGVGPRIRARRRYGRGHGDWLRTHDLAEETSMREGMAEEMGISKETSSEIRISGEIFSIGRFSRRLIGAFITLKTPIFRLKSSESSIVFDSFCVFVSYFQV